MLKQVRIKNRLFQSHIN